MAYNEFGFLLCWTSVFGQLGQKPNKKTKVQNKIHSQIHNVKPEQKLIAELMLKFNLSASIAENHLLVAVLSFQV